jgi:hypothetical protein
LFEYSGKTTGPLDGSISRGYKTPTIGVDKLNIGSDVFLSIFHDREMVAGWDCELRGVCA